MSIISSLMTGNFISMNETDHSRYVKESLALRDMDKATKIEQGRMVGGFMKTTADARTLSAIRNKRTSPETYDRNGNVSPSAHETAVALVKADTAETLAAKQAEPQKIEGAGMLDRTV